MNFERNAPRYEYRSQDPEFENIHSEIARTRNDKQQEDRDDVAVTSYTTREYSDEEIIERRRKAAKYRKLARKLKRDPKPSYYDLHPNSATWMVISPIATRPSGPKIRINPPEESR